MSEANLLRANSLLRIRKLAILLRICGCAFGLAGAANAVAAFALSGTGSSVSYVLHSAMYFVLCLVLFAVANMASGKSSEMVHRPAHLLIGRMVAAGRPAAESQAKSSRRWRDKCVPECTRTVVEAIGR